MTNRMRRRLFDAVHLPIAAWLAFVGASTLVAGPNREMTALLPEWLNLAWSAGLIVGGALIGWGVAFDATRAESTGHAFHLFGLGLFAVAFAVSLDVGAVAALLAVSAVSLLRMRVLRHSRAARREAGAILRGER